ncbi:TIR domain-containing protein [Burkholderia ubonensis]|uniref:TIR domain-containing protein n=1 Tax=Burkholderia ubonensis TaxID=101571 RepID=UPI0018DF7843|nr:TIR domain-containing protein [Burkholderia ubonensis]
MNIIRLSASHMTTNATEQVPKLQLQDVFKKSGVPTHTFVEPSEFNRLVVALRTPGRGIIIEGPSGIGKTSSVRRALEQMSEASYTFLSARRPPDVPLIEDLPNMSKIGLVIVDDFHRLRGDIKGRLSDMMKLLSDEEDQHSKLVLIGINRAGQSLIDHGEDLLHRVENIRFGRTNIERIVALIERGQRALNCTFAAAEALAEEAEGSFAMAQVLCHEACLQADVLESGSTNVQVTASVPAIREAVIRELSPAFFPAARDFATGNKLRREGRAPYLHLLKWLSNTAEGSLDTREALRANPALKGSVSQVIEKGHLSTLLDGNERLSKLLHFDERSQLLSSEDPKFLYFIRHLIWSKFARQVGYDKIDFASRYDFALSFAGEDRDVAKLLFDKLQAHEMQVFYDEQESHRILGNDVEQYLEPIYRTEASYVLPIVSQKYPVKVWTKFESDQFKDRFGSNSVIPVFLNDFRPTQFDVTGSVGYLTISTGEHLASDAERAVDSLCRKITEERAARDAIDDAEQPDLFDQ